MNPKAMIPLVAGLVVAGLGAKLGLDYVRKAQARPEAVQLWTPKQAIEAGMKIDPKGLVPLKFPASLIPKGAIRDRKKLEDRVAKTTIPPGVPIVESMLHPPGTLPGIYVPPGLRAVAVKIDEGSGVDYHIQPGSYVDVVGYFTIRRNGQQETIARTIIEDVRVAAVGQKITPDEQPGKDSKKSRRGRPARAVTLLVKPEDVPRLHLAEQRGKIKLSLRNPLEGDQVSHIAAASEDELLGIETGDKPQGGSPSEKNEPGLLGKLVSGFLARPNPSQPKPEPPPSDTASKPAFSWVMVLYNGDEQKVLAWRPDQPLKPIELGADGPNVFDDKPLNKLPVDLPPFGPPTVAPGSHPTTTHGRRVPADKPRVTDEEQQTPPVPEEHSE